MNLNGARALITGGSEGIGYAIAEAFSARKAKVAIMSRQREKVEKAAQTLGALAITGNVGVEADAVRAVKAVVETFGGIDVLVNNAGFGIFTPLPDMSLEEFQSVFATNVTGQMLMAREAARHFIKQGSGNLISISSTSGLRGGRGATAYSGSKFALRGMTECWREELRRHNVRVMLVNPSEVQTPFSEKVGHPQEPSPRKLRGQEIADASGGCLEVDDRGFIPELSVWATNPF